MRLLQDKRAWLGGGAILAVLIAAVSWFMVISPERSSTASFRTQVSESQLQNAVTQSKVAKLRAESQNLAKLTAALTAAFNALPKASGLPAFTRQLNAQAAASHVSVTSIAIGAITGVSADGTTVTPGAAPATTPDTTPSGTSPSGTPAPATAAGGVFAIPVTVISSGSLTHELAFLKAIQTLGPRRALVTSTQFTPIAAAVAPPIDKASTVTAQLIVFSAP
jgi:hypothetical protein